MGFWYLSRTARMAPLIAHVVVSSRDKGLKFVQNLHLQQRRHWRSVHVACTSFAMPLLTLFKNNTIIHYTDILMSNENAPPTKMTISFQRHNILFLQYCSNSVSY